MTESKMCPFCSPNVATSCFAESNKFRAIYNLAPILPGHCLIIPKKHVSSFLEVPDEYMNEMILFSRNVIKTLQTLFVTNSFDWTLQEGIPAGQTIEHMHIHIIPRKEKDLPHAGDWYPKMIENNNALTDSLNRQKLLPQEMRSIVDRLKKAYISVR